MAKLLGMSTAVCLLLSGLALAQSPAKLAEQVKAKAIANQAQADRDRDRGVQTGREGEHHRDYDHHATSKHKGNHDPFRQVSKGSRGREHGGKTGWGTCDVPPGQAKKQGCHPYHNRAIYPVRRTTKKPLVKAPTAEVHAHAGVDARVH